MLSVAIWSLWPGCGPNVAPPVTRLEGCPIPLFIAGECLAEGPSQTLQTMLHEAVHALAHVRGVKDTSRGGKYHNKREFVALAGELGLAWPQGQQPHSVIGFSEVQLTEPTLADYADTLAFLGRRSGCTATPSAAWACSAAKARSRAARTATTAAHRQDRRAVQGHLRLSAAPVVLDPRQAVHPRAHLLRGLRPGLPTQDTASNTAGRHTEMPAQSQVA